MSVDRAEGIPKWLIAMIVALTLGSLGIALESTGGEPFIAVKVRQVLSQVVAATALAVLWAEVLAYVVLGIFRGQYRKWKSALLLWALVMIGLLARVAWSYVADIVRYQQ